MAFIVTTKENAVDVQKFGGVVLFVEDPEDEELRALPLPPGRTNHSNMCCVIHTLGSPKGSKSAITTSCTCAQRHGGLLALWARRCLDPLPLRGLRLLCVGNVRSAVLWRRKSGGKLFCNSGKKKIVGKCPVPSACSSSTNSLDCVSSIASSSTPSHVPNFAQKSVQGINGGHLCTKIDLVIFGCLSNRLFAPSRKVLHDGKDRTRCSPTHVKTPPLQAHSTILQNISSSPFTTYAFDKKSV